MCNFVPMSKKSDTRVTARVGKETKDRLLKAADNLGLSESDLVRIGLAKFLPDIESGKLKLSIADLKKAA